MRVPSVPLAIGLCVALAACIPDKDKTPDWQKPPESWDPSGAEQLTFNAKGLEAFNAMLPDQRDQWIEEMKQKPGGFVGQTIYKQGAELTEAIDDYQYGSYEIYTELPDPVLYEITLNYRLYTTPEKGRSIPANAYVEFTGTLVDLVYYADSKPRKMDLKVKADDIKVLTNH